MNKITDDIRECVSDFYLHSDNCWMAPGRKDYINVVRDGQKVQEQSKYLLMTTQELLTLYTEEYADDCIVISSMSYMYLKVGTTHFIVWPFIIWCLASQLFY